MSRQHAWLVTIVMAGSLVGGSAGAADDPFAVVPSPGPPRPIIMVGTNAEATVAVGLAFQPDGPAAAYVCDGEKIATWFSGSLGEDEERVEMKSEEGDTFRADWSQPQATAQATLSGTTITFTLRDAEHGRFLRYATTVDGEPDVSGWIMTEDGGIFGARRRGGRLVRGVARSSSRQTPTEAGSLEPIPEPGGTEPGGQQLDPLVAKRRCDRLYSLVNARQDQLIGAGTSGEDILLDQQIRDLVARADKRGCARRGIGILLDAELDR